MTKTFVIIRIHWLNCFYTRCVLLSLSHIASSDPDMIFAMGEMNGATLVWTINGNVTNGATLVSGRFGKALFTDGDLQQYVTYGNHDTECYANASVCTGGLTYSLWVRLLRIQTTFWIFASGSLQKHVLGIENPISWSDAGFGYVFRQCVLPEGLAAKLGRNVNNKRTFESYRLQHGLTYFHIQIRCKNHSRYI